MIHLRYTLKIIAEIAESMIHAALGGANMTHPANFASTKQDRRVQH
jgi:hypothetical protein